MKLDVHSVWFSGRLLMDYVAFSYFCAEISGNLIAKVQLFTQIFPTARKTVTFLCLNSDIFLLKMFNGSNIFAVTMASFLRLSKFLWTKLMWKSDKSDEFLNKSQEFVLRLWFRIETFDVGSKLSKLNASFWAHSINKYRSIINNPSDKLFIKQKSLATAWPRFVHVIYTLQSLQVINICN